MLDILHHSFRAGCQPFEESHIVRIVSVEGDLFLDPVLSLVLPDISGLIEFGGHISPP